MSATYPSLARNPARLRLDSYPVRFDLPLRWSDVVNGNRVGTIGLARYYEDARMEFIAALAGKARLHDGTWKGFLRQCSIELLGDVTFPTTLTVGGGVLHVGTTSYRCGFGLFQHGVCVSLSDATVVLVDNNGRPRAVAEEAKALLQRERLAA